MKLIVIIASLQMAICNIGFTENINPKVNSFKTINAPNGTDPVATSPTSTLNLTSVDNSVTITGDATTKTINFAAVGAGTGANITLNNLLSVAINTALLPGVTNSIGLGSTSKDWAFGNIRLLNDSVGDPSVNAYGRLLSDGTLAQLTWSGSGVAFSQLTATTVPYLNASKILTSSAVTPTELGYLSGVTSAIQTQIAAKAPSASPTFSGTITTPLTASRALTTNGSSQLAVSATTSTELGYVNGVTSAIQTQIDTKAPTASPTFTGSVTTAAGTALAPAIKLGASTSNYLRNCDNEYHGTSPAMCLGTGGTSGSDIIMMGNANGTGIPIIGSPLNTGLAIVSGVNTTGGVGNVGAEIRIFSRFSPGHGSVLTLANIADYQGNTFGFGLDDAQAVYPFKVGFIGTDGLMVGASTNPGTYPTYLPSAKLEVYEAASSTASYLKVDSNVTGRTSSDGLRVGVDASGGAQINNLENTDLSIYTNAALNMTFKAAGGLTYGNYHVEPQAPGSVNCSGTTNLDLSTGNVFQVTLTGSCTITFSNPQNGAPYLLVLKQDATGSRSLTLPTIHWQGNGTTAPTFTATANHWDEVNLKYYNSLYTGIAALDFN